MNKITIFIIAIIVLGAGALYIYSRIAPTNPIGGAACTTEAKQCPDGSYVGRTGPACEFATCPEEKVIIPPNTLDSGIKGTVLLGPTCPVMRDPPDPQCADKAYKTNLVLTTADQSRVITQFSSDANGKFNIKIQPGEYAIRSAAVANILPYCASNGTVRVNANSYVETTVYCDTGIR